jgi:hypothetical protein
MRDLPVSPALCFGYLLRILRFASSISALIKLTSYQLNARSWMVRSRLVSHMLHSKEVGQPLRHAQPI